MQIKQMMDEDIASQSIEAVVDVYCHEGSLHVMNGHMLVSRNGLHLYGVRKHGSEIYVHIPMCDIVQVTPKTITAMVYLPLGKTTYTIYLGLQDYGGRLGGMFRMIDAQKSKDGRVVLVEMIEMLKQQAPSLPLSSTINPHVRCMQYFLYVSVNAALYFADNALKFAQKQDMILQGPGFFRRLDLEVDGYKHRADQFPVLTQTDVIAIKRRRAWLLFDGRRFTDLIQESKMPEQDAEILLAYALAYVHTATPDLTQAQTFLQMALHLEPQNVKVRACELWFMAKKGRSLLAQQQIIQLQSAAQSDRQGLYILARAVDENGKVDLALHLYNTSASLAHGTFEGNNACTNTHALASREKPQERVQIAYTLTTLLPDHQKAWALLEMLATISGDMQMTQIANKRLQASFYSYDIPSTLTTLSASLPRSIYSAPASSQHTPSPFTVPTPPPATVQKAASPPFTDPIFSTTSEMRATSSVSSSRFVLPVKEKKRMPIFAICLMVLLVGFSLFGGIHYKQHLDIVNATQTALDNANATDTANSDATATTIQNLYTSVTNTRPTMSDSLSVNSSGLNWYEIQDTSNAFHCHFKSGSPSVYQDGSYNSYDLCPEQGMRLTHFAFQADVSLESGDCGGLAFHVDYRSKTFYAFLICIDADPTNSNNMPFDGITYEVVKQPFDDPNAAPSVLMTGSSSDIQFQYNTPYRLTVIANGKMMYFFVGDQHLKDVPDVNAGPGYVGFDTFEKRYSPLMDCQNVKIWRLQ